MKQPPLSLLQPVIFGPRVTVIKRFLCTYKLIITVVLPHVCLFVCLWLMQQNQGDQLGEALESTVDAQEWRLEVERVLPALKIHVRQDNRVRNVF